MGSQAHGHVPGPIKGNSDDDSSVKALMRMAVNAELKCAPKQAGEQPLAGFRGELTPEQERLIVAVVTKSASYVKLPDQPGHIHKVKAEDSEINAFIKLAREDPAKLSKLEDAVILQTPKGAEEHPDSWRWEGPMARYRIERANLNKTANEKFGTTIPVVEYELSTELLMKHAKEKYVGK